MKIKNSEIRMQSDRRYEKREQTTKNSTVIMRGGARQNTVTLSISKEGKRLAGQGQGGNRTGMATARMERAKRRNTESKEDATLQTLKKILELLRQMQDAKNGIYGRSYNYSTEYAESIDLTFSSGVPLGQGVIQTETASFMAETENTSFSAAGIAQTEDGRQIDFQIDVEMSRSFVKAHREFSQLGNANLTDPLVINVGSNVTQVGDQKFLFDLDADGTEEEISYLRGGNGFLALDKNGDGRINDGNELFGTKSGDGFADLAAYDEDGNGWIDENDSVFRNLKVWFKGEDGTDRLLNLKSADVGAIYLGKVETGFSLNQAQTNETNAIIRETGIFLKESGGAGTVQHVDFAI